MFFRRGCGFQAATAALLACGAWGKNIKVTNSCSGTIVPTCGSQDGTTCTANGASVGAGFVLAPGASKTVQVPNKCEWIFKHARVKPE